MLITLLTSHKTLFLYDMSLSLSLWARHERTLFYSYWIKMVNILYSLCKRENRFRPKRYPILKKRCFACHKTRLYMISRSLLCMRDLREWFCWTKPLPFHAQPVFSIGYHWWHKIFLFLYQLSDRCSCNRAVSLYSGQTTHVSNITDL